MRVWSFSQLTFFSSTDDGKDAQHTVSGTAAAPSGSKKKRPFKSSAWLSKVGFVPFNPNKVNQDRAIEVSPFAGDEERAFFGVFDGHGAVGHDVSEYVSKKIPDLLSMYMAIYENDPNDAFTRAFVESHHQLQLQPNIDSSFSGTTAIAVFFDGNKIFSCNAGDSRAVLARVSFFVFAVFGGH